MALSCDKFGVMYQFWWAIPTLSLFTIANCMASLDPHQQISEGIFWVWWSCAQWLHDSALAEYFVQLQYSSKHAVIYQNWTVIRLIILTVLVPWFWSSSGTLSYLFRVFLVIISWYVAQTIFLGYIYPKSYWELYQLLFCMHCIGCPLSSWKLGRQ